ncbi:protein BPS1, chloroplastic-like [Prosopis cineraria]|uniref:protein BPS1, chloroplastic-like n=1 Tax=Prosopis cineraria TaxID=364024 RepID=UPI0024101E5F|nr:protein BPS1, chloroplastic-like [Prosopis cineraria]
MALLLQKFAKYQKQTPPLRHDSEEEHALSASLQDFRSQISKLVAQLGFSLEHAGSQNLSLSWINKFFGLLQVTHKAFANLVVDIDYPISKWSSDSIEGYLNYCLALLQLFNAISSSLSLIGQSRLSLSFGLIKFKKSASSAKDYLKGIEIGPGKNKTSPNLEGGFCSGRDKSKGFSCKERVLGESIQELRTVGFWVCGIVLSGVAGDAGSYMEIRKKLGSSSVVAPLDSKIGEKLPALKEVKEINDAVGDLLAASESDDAVKDDAAMELQKKVDLFQKGLDDLSKEVDDMFNKVMTQRNELIDCFRFRDRSPRKSVV